MRILTRTLEILGIIGLFVFGSCLDSDNSFLFIIMTIASLITFAVASYFDEDLRHEWNR